MRLNLPTQAHLCLDKCNNNLTYTGVINVTSHVFVTADSLESFIQAKTFRPWFRDSISKIASVNSGLSHQAIEYKFHARQSRVINKSLYLNIESNHRISTHEFDVQVSLVYCPRVTQLHNDPNLTYAVLGDNYAVRQLFLSLIIPVIVPRVEAFLGDMLQQWQSSLSF